MLQPWKLITLAIGLIILVCGSYYEQAPDWDVGISLTMGICAYLYAPKFILTIYRKDWWSLPPELCSAWFSIDGAYWMYNYFMHHPYVREANIIASTPLFLLCGILWAYDGSLKDMLRDVRSLRLTT